MAKQGENIYQRKDGRWEGRYIKGYKPDRTPLYGYAYGKDYNTVFKKIEPFKQKYQRPQNAVGFTGMFSDYCVGWLEMTTREKKIKQSTYCNYYRDIRNHIVPALGGNLPHMINKIDIEDFMDKLREKRLSEGTIANVMRLLFAIIGKAREDGVIVDDICKKVKIPHHKKKKITVLSRTEQCSLELICEREKTGLLPLLALYTGMRVGEISALKWSDIDLEEGLLYVRETAQRLSNYDDTDDCDTVKTEINFGSPKTETSERVIALSPKLIVYLRERKAKSDCAYVISVKGHSAEPRVCQYRFDSLLKKAGVKKINFHSLRHTFATRCLEEGMDLKTLSELMGHSDVKMTLRYGKSLTEHKKKAVMLLDHVSQIAV